MGTCRWKYKYKYKYKSNYDYTHRKNTSYKQEGLHMQVQIWVGSTISWSHNGIVFFGCQRMPWRANTWFANVYSWSWSVREDIERVSQREEGRYYYIICLISYDLYIIYVYTCKYIFMLMECRGMSWESVTARGGEILFIEELFPAGGAPLLLLDRFVTIQYTNVSKKQICVIQHVVIK